MIALLHHSVAEQALLRPEAIAFRCRDEDLSYAELYARSSRLAHALLKLDLKPMDRVGILMTKQIEMPIAVYGILAAGGCYVPIDPNSTLDRLQFILHDCGIQILIVSDGKRKIAARAASAHSGIRCILGTRSSNAEGLPMLDWSELADYPATAPKVETQEDDLAYIMYTSGSTGSPKGLMHTHRSGLAYARYSSALYDVRSTDRLGNHAPLHFDISTFEYFTGPYAGATSILIPEEEIMMPASLARLIERERLTFWYSVPLALVQLLTQGDLNSVNLSSLRWVLFGGEAIAPARLHELMDTIPQARFCNVYGPAEVNQCTYYHVPPQFDRAAENVPIGQAWPGARLRIVDSADQPVAEGESGELLVASATAMQGYWGRPDLNQRAFLVHEPLPGVRHRYYRTGDVVSSDADGLLHFHGRKDRQIKIRGYRLELDEVESAFSSQAAVEAAAVIALDKGESDKDILAFILPRHPASFDRIDCMAAARAKLPHYAVPQRLEVVDTLPRTATGKIDRRLLMQTYGNATV